jgi:hypothetical protein
LDDYEGHKKLHFANWQLISMKKEFGGLGIPNLKYLNLCLLGSWVKRFMVDENNLWRRVVDNIAGIVTFSTLTKTMHHSFGRGLS